METIIQRNHYGLEATSRQGNTIFRTMKNHRGIVYTSVWSVLPSSTVGITATTPTGERHIWPKEVKRLTAKNLKEIHESNIKNLLPTLKKPVKEAQSIFNI